MHLEEKLTALLRTICPNVFADFAPGDTPVPYVVYQQIGGQSDVTLDNLLLSKRNAWMQTEVWASTVGEAVVTMLAIEQALVSAKDMQASPMAAMTRDFDSATGRRAARQDFDIWADR